jgi:hypothetical protein
MLVLFGTSASAKVATPCTASNGSPVSAMLPVCVGGYTFFPTGKPGTTARITVLMGSMTGRPLANVRVVALLPTNIKPMQAGSRPYKLVNKRPTWIIHAAPPHTPLMYNLTVRTPMTGKPGSQWCARLNANVVGQKAVSKSQPVCAQYVTSTQ